jgi:hypothetical protein
VNISEFIADEGLLGPFHAGPSWQRWRACLRAAFALPLSPAEADLFGEVAGGRAPPQRPVGELDVIVGRGGAKSTTAADLATFVAVTVDSARLRPGERAVILCLAVDRDQAAIVFNYIRAYFEQVPMLAFVVERITANTIDLTNGAQIVVGTNSYRSVRGRTFACVIFDEVAYWRGDTSANPDTETDVAVTPGLARWPGALKILISSPYRRAGLLFQRWRESFGKDDDDRLVVHGTTRQFNPTFPQEVVDRELQKDPEKARSEYLAEWRDDISNFIDRAAVEACIVSGCYERPRLDGISYVAFCDPSSGAGADSMTLSIAHKPQSGATRLDVLREVRPPFDPAAVTAEFAAVVKAYGIHKITKDCWALGFVDAAFREHGITCKPSDKTRSELYLDLLPMINSSQVELLDNDRLINQLCNLERRVARSGKDSINHPDGAHDDLINAAAGALVLAAVKRPAIIFTTEMVARLQNQPSQQQRMADPFTILAPNMPFHHLH